jgi:hypothetical protein
MRMKDGASTIEFLSWMSPEPKGFSIMPSTVRIGVGELLSAVRREENGRGFIETYRSSGNGCIWGRLGRVADVGSQGNPASMVRIAGGRLIVTYGQRAAPMGIRARMSSDHGGTWSPEIHLRDDSRAWDLGYPRSFGDSVGHDSRVDQRVWKTGGRFL